MCVRACVRACVCVFVCVCALERGKKKQKKGTVSGIILTHISLCVAMVMACFYGNRTMPQNIY